MAIDRLIMILVLMIVTTGLPASANRQTNNFLSPRVFKQIEKVNEAIDAEDYTRALEQLDGLKKLRLSTFEQAVDLRTRGYIAIRQDQLDDAITHYEAALALEVIEPASANEMRYNVGQLHLARERPNQAIKWLEDWRTRVEAPRGDALMTLAYAYVQVDQTENAYATARKAIEPPGTAAANWYNFAAAMAMLLNKPDPAVELLQQGLIVHPDEDTLWSRLAAVYVEINEKEKALATAQLARAQGALSDGSEQKFLAQLYLNAGLPFEGATLLAETLKAEKLKAQHEDYDFISSAYLLAREEADALPYLIEAAQASDDGKLYHRLGSHYLADEKWIEAAQAFEAALEKGKLGDEAQTRLSLGIAELERGRFKAAEAAFRKARRSEKLAERARTWLAELAIRRDRASAEGV